MNKKLAFTAIALAVVSCWAQAQAAQCPAGTKTLYSCRSTPKAGDNVIASSMLDSIAVCVENADKITERTLIVAEKDGDSNQGYVAVSTRPGGVDYTDSTDADLDVTLSLPAGLNPTIKEVTGQLHLLFHGPKMSAAATFTCEKN